MTPRPDNTEPDAPAWCDECEGMHREGAGMCDMKPKTDLTAIVRAAARGIDTGSTATIGAACAPIRAALAERGLAPGCHVGRKDMGATEAVEWFAGQLLEIVDAKAWFAVNSWLNCVDKFAPEIKR